VSKLSGWQFSIFHQGSNDGDTHVSGGAKLVKNRRFEIPVAAARNSVRRGVRQGVT
jgi:hypothetical protein